VKALKSLIKNCEFIKLFVVSCIVNGAFNGIGGIIGFLIEPYKINHTQTANMLVVLPIAGLIGSGAGGKILKET